MRLSPVVCVVSCRVAHTTAEFGIVRKRVKDDGKGAPCVLGGEGRGGEGDRTINRYVWRVGCIFAIVFRLEAVRGGRQWDVWLSEKQQEQKTRAEGEATSYFLCSKQRLVRAVGRRE